MFMNLVSHVTPKENNPLFFENAAGESVNGQGHKI